MIPAAAALERLRAGNREFASGAAPADAVLGSSRRRELAERQAPFAVVVGCSDSRVPAELVFRQGVGDLFVVRVAGNVVGPSQAGSVEFAAAQLGTRLVVVLGHSRCGAVLATLEELRSPGAAASPDLRSIVDRIRPSVEELLASGLDDEELVRRAVRDNVRLAVDRLRHGSELLAGLARDDGLWVVGAEYSLSTGLVDFFDPPSS